MTIRRVLRAGILGRVASGIGIASFLLMIAGASPGQAQDGQGPYITQASQRLVSLIATANTAGYKLNDNKLSIGGGWLKQGSDGWVILYELTLKQGKHYRFLAAGDNDATDVDIEVQNAGGTAVASDDTNDRDAIINDYTPPETGQFKVRIRLYASQNNVPCVCLAVAMVKN